MVKFFSQTHKYDDPWSTVTLAYFLRYPNPYASHVIACDVISRTVTDSGTLKTTRLIKKTGAIPAWFPSQFVTRAETWVVEESEVDPEGRVTTCRTRNLDHVKVMQVQEDVVLREAEENKTIQKTTANVISNFGWGLTKKIEMYGVTKFKTNLERSRQGLVTVLSALRESRQRLGFYAFTGVPADPTFLNGPSRPWSPSTSENGGHSTQSDEPSTRTAGSSSRVEHRPSSPRLDSTSSGGTADSELDRRRPDSRASIQSVD